MYFVRRIFTLAAIFGALAVLPKALADDRIALPERPAEQIIASFPIAESPATADLFLTSSGRLFVRAFADNGVKFLGFENEAAAIRMGGSGEICGNLNDPSLNPECTIAVVFHQLSPKYSGHFAVSDSGQILMVNTFLSPYDAYIPLVVSFYLAPLNYRGFQVSVAPEHLIWLREKINSSAIGSTYDWSSLKISAEDGSLATLADVINGISPCEMHLGSSILRANVRGPVVP